MIAHSTFNRWSTNLTCVTGAEATCLQTIVIWLASNCSLIYRCRQIAVILQSFWFSFPQKVQLILQLTKYVNSCEGISEFLI